MACLCQSQTSSYGVNMPRASKPIEGITVDDARRFYSHTWQSGDCWIWTGGSGTGGYGRWRHDGSPVLPHRFSYTYMISDIPDGLVLDHACRNRLCVNPYHLEPVTNRVNIRRGSASLRVDDKHCKRGHERSDANTYRRKNGYADCRVCDSERKRG